MTVIDCSNITGAKAPVAPVLNTPLFAEIRYSKIRKERVKFKLNHDEIISYDIINRVAKVVTVHNDLLTQ